MRYPIGALLLVLILALGVSAIAYAEQGGGWTPATPDAVADDTASLHNPGFDNHDWYEFNDRYGNYVVGSWLPDDDNNTGNTIPESTRQDWRLWFMNGYSLIEIDPEQTYQRDGSEGVQVRTYDGNESAHQIGGVYQIVHNTIPCLTYRFQMYAESYPEQKYWDAVLKVGIDQVGWDLVPEHRPAVHEFPSTMVWGAAHDYKFPNYGLLTVEAEALNDKITVFTYADAPGGRYHRVLWDTGSLAEITSDQLQLVDDPDNPPAATLSASVTAGSTSAVFTWNTTTGALGQVYYRLVRSNAEVTPPSGTFTHTAYLPYIASSPNPWQVTSLAKTNTTAHSVSVTGLSPNSVYEYFVASRGVSNGVCVTWVSSKAEFTTTQ